MSNLTDRIGIAKPGRFCVLHSYFGGGRDILVCLNVGRSSLPRALVCRACDGWLSGVGINPSAKFLKYKAVSEGRPGGIVLARLICTRCKADVKSVVRCRRCGALCPTSAIGAAILSPTAFAFYILVLVVVAIFWFA